VTIAEPVELLLLGVKALAKTARIDAKRRCWRARADDFADLILRDAAKAWAGGRVCT
jgi:hypothetical protein